MHRFFALALLFAFPAIAQPAAGFKVQDEGVAEPLAAPGDAARGRTLIATRDPANCILCHPVTEAGVRFAGNLGPRLDGVGTRMTQAQLRLRLIDSSQLNPQSIMPAYFKTAGLIEVAAAYRGKTILTAQQIEDLVVYLSTLR